LKNNYKTAIETNGSINIKDLIEYESLLISFDVKCPSSNMHKKIQLKNIKLLRKDDLMKFVIDSKEDYNYAKNIIKKYKPNCDVFFQPVWGRNPKKLAEWIIDDKLNVRFSLQLHKLIWDEKKGV